MFFFFSSRRRHTRSLCDWSSDVCSSDLRRTASASANLPCALRVEPRLVSEKRTFGLSSPKSLRWIERAALDRSEEHTSELQSHSDLVCRLLLEKKKRSNITARTRSMHPA